MNTVTSPAICSRCGGALPPHEPGEQCLRCALQLGMDAAAEAPAQATGPGKTFAGYELLEQIARGGMGVIFKARHSSLNRVVALKLVLRGEFANEAEIKRFQFEAEAAANLDHPNIVPIYDVGEHQGCHFFSMKYLAGGSLAARMADGAWPGPHHTRGTAGLVAKVARAVHYAHRCGILHRDLKPSNILLDENGEPLVADFGLARRVSGDVSLTLSQSVLGSPHYMAPEQAAGKARHLTTAADVYSLGVILYELLTGRPPFVGETPLATLKLVVEQPPEPPRRINPAVNRELETICLKCLEKDPQRRYASAEALAEDLERWMDRRPIAARRSTVFERAWKWIKREPIKTALVAALILAVVGPCAVAIYYLRQLPHMASTHHVVTEDLDGVYWLRLYDAKGERCSLNFLNANFQGARGQVLRLQLANVPVDLVSSLRFRVHADQPGRPDPPRSPVLTNGQEFRLRVEDRIFDRGFYLAEIGFAASNLVAVASNATAKLVMVK